MEKDKGQITVDNLIQRISMLQRLQEEGIHVGTLPDKLWQEVVDLIEGGDCEKLGQLRQELKEMKNEP